MFGCGKVGMNKKSTCNLSVDTNNPCLLWGSWFSFVYKSKYFFLYPTTFENMSMGFFYNLFKARTFWILKKQSKQEKLVSPFSIFNCCWKILVSGVWRRHASSYIVLTSCNCWILWKLFVIYSNIKNHKLWRSFKHLVSLRYCLLSGLSTKK